MPGRLIVCVMCGDIGTVGEHVCEPEAGTLASLAPYTVVRAHCGCLVRKLISRPVRPRHIETRTLQACPQHHLGVYDRNAAWRDFDIEHMADLLL